MPATLLKETPTQVFSSEYSKIFNNITYFEKYINGCLCRLQKFIQTYRKPNGNEVWIKIKIYCLVWTDFTTCPSVFIADFEQVSTS